MARIVVTEDTRYTGGGGVRTFFSFFFLNKTLNSSGMCAFDLGSIARALVVGKRG